MISINDNIHCRLLSISDAEELYDIVNFSRNYLTNLVWVNSATLESTEQFLKIKSDTLSGDTLYGIYVDHILVGTIEFRYTDDIGYWLRHDYRNKGIMTSVVNVMTKIKGANKELLAKVQYSNEVSKKILANAGFKCIRTDEEFLYLKRASVKN